MNSVLQDEDLVFPQQPMIDVTIVTNHYDKSEGFVSQQSRDPLTTFNHEGNQSENPMGSNWNKNLSGTWMLLEDMKPLK